MSAVPVGAFWQRAGVRAGLTAGALNGQPIQVDGPAMDPFMSALVRYVRRLPEPAGSLPDLRRVYADGLGLTTLRRPRGLVVRDIAVPGGAETLPAREYQPASPRGTLLYFHGGGFVMGDLDTHDGLCATLAARTGLRVVSVAYRLAPEHVFPAAADDAIAALRCAAAEADRPLAVAGDSAGAQLAVVATQALPSAAPAAHLLLYPVVDMVGEYASVTLFGEGFLLTNRGMAACAEAYIPAGVDRAEPRLSPLRAAPPQVPTAVVTAGFDPIRDQGRAYVAVLRDMGVTAELIEEERLVHGFADFAGVVPEARRAVDRAAAALSRLLGGS